MRQIYEFQALTWNPAITNVYKVLPEPNDTELRALYLGDVYPENLLRNVYRFSLYADKIYIVDPFHTPWNMAAEFNPIENPDQYTGDTLKLCFFLLALAPWIEAGLVQLIPDPSDFDHRMKMQAFASAKARIGKTGLSSDDSKYYEGIIKEDFLRSQFRLDASALRRYAHSIGMSDEAADVLVAEASRRRKVDPLMIDRDFTEREEQISVSRAGANLEVASFLCQLTGAFPYTDAPGRRRELDSTAQVISRTAGTWTPLTHAFRRLDFSFLDNVDSRFALEIRKGGRLSGFRGMLRRIWQTATSTGEQVDDAVVRNFVDSLTEEYSAASSDYASIKRDLGRSGGLGIGLAGAAAATAALSHGNMALTIPLAGYTLVQVSDWIKALGSQRAFKKNAMSVFLDLAAKKSRKSHK